MRITEVRIRPTNAGRVRARVSITIDDSFRVGGLRVIRRGSRYSLQFPRRRQSNGSYADLVVPMNAETRKMIEDAVFAEFEKVTGEHVTRRVLKQT